MFKNRNRTWIFLLLLFVGNLSFVFAIDFSQALSQANEKAFSISSLFQGKAHVGNLYAKSLKLVKDREVTATTFALDEMVALYSHCKNIKKHDIINILYYTNSSFRITFFEILPKKTKYPTVNDIRKSYQNFFVCKGITSTVASAEQIESINDELQRHFSDLYGNTFTFSTLNNDNFGSDFFWNGTLDDSDFDLLYDINQIGKLLFEAFKDSPEILFYRLPEVDSVSARGGDSSSISDQGAYQLGGGGSSTSTTSSLIQSDLSLSTEGLSVQTITSPSSSLDSQPSLYEDKEIQSFIEHTNISDTAGLFLAGPALIYGNQCLFSDIPLEDEVLFIEEEPDLLDSEQYIAAITDFIESANINDMINDHLLSAFYDNFPLSKGGSTSDTGYASSLANIYAEQAFGDAAPGTCEYACNTMPLDKQVQCQLSCTMSCIKACDDIVGIQNKALCMSDCMCFLVAGPNGLGREKVEDMYRIKFCKVPVQKKTVSKGKKVFSIQAIFQEIHDVLEGLRDSGQMIEFSKKKEFLDGNIKTKLVDNFAFMLQVGFKPVFKQRSISAETKSQEEILNDFNRGVININTSNPTADDYNKYIVISDPIRSHAEFEYAASLDDIQSNIDSFSSVIQAGKKHIVSLETLNALSRTYANDANIVFVDNMITFLQNNQIFWNNLIETLLDMSIMSAELRDKIESSK